MRAAFSSNLVVGNNKRLKILLTLKLKYIGEKNYIVFPFAFKICNSVLSKYRIYQITIQ